MYLLFKTAGLPGDEGGVVPRTRRICKARSRAREIGGLKYDGQAVGSPTASLTLNWAYVAA